MPLPPLPEPSRPSDSVPSTAPRACRSPHSLAFLPERVGDPSQRCFQAHKTAPIPSWPCTPSSRLLCSPSWSGVSPSTQLSKLNCSFSPDTGQVVAGDPECSLTNPCAQEGRSSLGTVTSHVRFCPHLAPGRPLQRTPASRSNPALTCSARPTAPPPREPCPPSWKTPWSLRQPAGSCKRPYPSGATYKQRHRLTAVGGRLCAPRSPLRVLCPSYSEVLSAVLSDSGGTLQRSHLPEDIHCISRT